MKRKLHKGSFFYYVLFIIFLSTTTVTNAQAPVNDDCAGSVTLTPAAGCVNVAGDMRNATISAGVPANCAIGFLYDVWYNFTATNANNTITISGFGNKFTRRQIEVYEGTCGGLIPIPALCSPLSIAGGSLAVSSTDFSPGTKYYIRVLYPNTVPTPITTVSGAFNICVTTAAVANTPVLSVGRSYVIYNKPQGGVIQTGDTLEIRNAISITGGTIYNLTLHDTIATGLSFIKDSTKFKTNEAMIYASGITGSKILTDASGDDEVVVSTSAGVTIIRINIGSLTKTSGQTIFQAQAATTPITYASAGGGKLNYKGRPNFYGTNCVLMVTYLAKVTAATNTNFLLHGGTLRYKTATSSTDDIGFPQTSKVLDSSTVGVSTFTTICQNGLSINQFAGGDFGSGTTKHDSTQLTIAPGYTWAPLSSGGPQDGLFAVVNNTSSANATSRTAPYTGANRVFTLWDVIGDHTGAATSAGNNAVPWGTTGGYAAVVNAAFGINNAITKTTTGLCTDTYYEFSAWFKNICIGCSCDSAGNGISPPASFKTYLAIKTVNDSTGVLPNLTFLVDGVDKYVTGDIPYNDKWIRKAFVFKTGPAQTSATLIIRNNAPGGGGNDWAMDDIQLSTCGPSLSMNAVPFVLDCKETLYQINLVDTVRYLYNNSYIYYKWQKKTLASGVWVDVPGTSGIANGSLPQPPNSPAPVLVNGQWQYTTSITFTPAITDSGTLYRVITGTTAANVNNSCSFTDGSTTMIKLVTCGIILNSKILLFKGALENNNAVLNWQSIEDSEFSNYELQRSDDNINFYTITRVNGKNLNYATDYSYKDAVPVISKTYYRLKLIYKNGLSAYSNVVVLNNRSLKLEVTVDKNPFTDLLSVKIILPEASIAAINIFDISGRKVFTQTQALNKGLNQVTINNIRQLNTGLYFLSVTNNNEQTPQIKVLKY